MGVHYKVKASELLKRVILKSKRRVFFSFMHFFDQYNYYWEGQEIRVHACKNGFFF